MELNESEFINQFDDLKIKLNTVPISANDSINTDLVMKRDIELKNGYLASSSSYDRNMIRLWRTH